MKALKTQDCICTLVAVAFGNKKLDSKELDDAVKIADKELSELVRLASYHEPKKITINTINRINGNFDRYRCPSCGEILTYDRKWDKYCLSCGQALDWSETQCE